MSLEEVWRHLNSGLENPLPTQFQWAQKIEHKNTDDGGLVCEVSKYLKDSIRAIQFGELKILLQLGLKNQQ